MGRATLRGGTRYQVPVHLARRAQAAAATRGNTSDVQATQRRKAPTAREKPASSASDAVVPRERVQFNLGEYGVVADLGPESWGVIGQTILVDNSFWGPEYDDGLKSVCTVDGYIGTFSFSESHSRHTYVIDYNGDHYPIKHTMVLQGLQDAQLKRRLNKAGAPRATE